MLIIPKMYYFLCSAVGGLESKMKFSTRLVESPPPKPPRRRYSEQHSPPYLGMNFFIIIANYVILLPPPHNVQTLRLVDS